MDGKDWWQRHREAFLLFVQATAQRRPVLIHCMHGLHRTGAFASFCQALRVWMNSSEQKLWSECLMHGWQTFCSGRKLKERSVGVVKRNGQPRNFAFEPWRATTELYGALTLVQLRWLTESVASVESVASATAALATATQDMAHRDFSSSRQSPSPPQRQQQQQKQPDEEEHEEEQEEEEHEEEKEEEEEGEERRMMKRSSRKRMRKRRLGHKRRSPGSRRRHGRDRLGKSSGWTSSLVIGFATNAGTTTSTAAAIATGGTAVAKPPVTLAGSQGIGIARAATGT